MKTVIVKIIQLCFFLPCLVGSLAAQDMREVNLEAEAEKLKLFEQAAREKEQAQQQAAESRAVILRDRTQLEQAITAIGKKKKAIEKKIEKLQQERKRVAQEETAVQGELAQTNQMVNELVGFVRITGKDVEGLYNENLQAALQSDQPTFLQVLGDDSRFPGMDSIAMLTDLLFDQVEKMAEVKRLVGSIVGRNGSVVEAEILVVGPFCAAYRIGDEVGFLRYSSKSRTLYALTKLPPKRMQKQINQYMDGEKESVIMDIGRGAALQQLSHSLSLWEQVEEGGPVVWPIVAIFFFGLLIVVERIIFLLRKHLNSDGFMKDLTKAAELANWKQCETFCDRYQKKPVARVISAGIQCRKLGREEMENVLQEAILREIPPMERFLSTLGMLAAIAPLLGLLGTVTGMIDTFHIITLHGTSDPRLMSGGISEALVTTMLGLGVAIPLMLAQTLLNRSVEKEIGTMEEKAVALVNIIDKSRLN